MIRKSGLLLFVFLFVIIIGFVYFLAGPIVRITMVYTLEKAFGAEVNIDDVDIGLRPASLDIVGLAITDLNEPERNVISFQSARADLEVWPALMGYYVIDELSVQGLAFGSTRARAGEVYRGENALRDDEGGLRATLKDKLNIDLPSADNLMERMNLKTVDKGRELQEHIEQERKVLADLEAQLPDKSKLQEIEQKIKALTDSKIENAADLATKTEQLRALQSQLKEERKQLKSIQQRIAESRNKIANAVIALQEAKDADFEKVRGMTDLENGGLASIGQVLLGDVWGNRVAQLASFYRLVEPYIPESGDETGESDEAVRSLPNRILPIPNKPYPGLWVKHAVLHWFVGGGEAEVDLHNLTFEHDIIGQATQFKVSAQTLPNLDSLLVEGQFKVDDVLSTAAEWQVSGVRIADLEALDKIGLKLDQGVLDSSGSVQLNNRQLDQQATLTLNQPSFTAVGERYSQQLATVLNQQNTIPVKISATGTVSSPDISINSPLDRLLADALLGDVKQKAEALEAELNKRINEVYKNQMSGQGDLLAAIDNQQQQVEQLDQIIEDGLTSELKSLEDQTKDKIKDKLFKLGK